MILLSGGGTTMMTVHEVSKLTGVIVRTLHYYDTIGLLKPQSQTEAGYRLYDNAALERMQNILLFRELEFPLKEIKKILDSPDFDKAKALTQQITMLRLKKEHLDTLIHFALELKKKGIDEMNFKAFETKEMDSYAAEAKASWGQSTAYKEFEEKTKSYSQNEWGDIYTMLMQQFTAFGTLLQEKPDSEPVQKQVALLQQYISKHFYHCTNEIFAGLGQMYLQDERFLNNIDKAGGKGTAAFVSSAIDYYCSTH